MTCIYTGVIDLVEETQETREGSSQGTDCSQILAQSPKASSGVYVIKPPGAKTPFQVYCEMREDGGWIVFQRRSGEALSFNKKWEEYKHGFGKLKHDHWLGLNKVFLLSQVETWALRVDLWDHDGGSAYAQYENFRIENEKTAFKLHIGEFSGNAGDAFRGSYPGGDQNGFGFSTADRDNDGCSPCIFDDMAQLDCTFSAGVGQVEGRRVVLPQGQQDDDKAVDSS
ncbi:angiopoietin-related protein 5-like [Cynoglossus semilaevis]|uniref:angiopoietin-related protein 5-like n=1 Tax=Cynoglossus semilaevis TaxID=244447 RepID=UPI000D62AE2C|nr:angiopoietin-related protein 5-like [Cynoglossus semilaevis]